MSKCKNPNHILLSKMMDDLHVVYEALTSAALDKAISSGAVPSDSLMAAAKVGALMCTSLVSASIAAKNKGKSVPDDDHIEEMMDTTLELMVTAIGFVEEIDIEYGLASYKKEEKWTGDADKKPKLRTVH